MSSARTARRALTIPAVVALHLLLVLSAPVTVAIAAGLSVVVRSTRPVRSVLLVVTYSALELVTLLRIAELRRRGADQEQWQDVMRWVAGKGEATLRHVLGVRTDIEPGSCDRSDLDAADGIVVLARHAGPGDTLLVAWLLVVHYRLRLQIVLKRLLRVIPAIDLAGDELPFCFVGVRRRAARAGIGRLASALSRGDALLLFPEGGNFSRKRWRDGTESLTRAGAFDRLRRLRHNRHTLPPRVGGVVAALSAAPGAAGLLVAHSGLGPRGEARPWWRLPLDHRVVFRTLLIPADEVPRDAEAIPQWLDEMWTRVDTWVDSFAVLDASTDAA